MATVIMLKKGQLNIEKALKKMDWDTEKFEEELEMLAKTQPPKIQEKIRKQYNRYMAGCGWPMELVVVSESKRSVKVKTKQPKVPDMGVPRMTQQIEVKPDSEKEIQSPQTTTALATIPPISVPTEEPKEIGNNEKVDADPILPKVEDVIHYQPETDNPVKVIVADAYFSVADPIPLKHLFETIHGILDEVTFQIEPDRLLIRAMDPGRVCMIDYSINKEHFEEWQVNKPGYATFNIEEVLKIVFTAIKKDTIIRLTVNPVTDKLIFTLRDSRTRTREFPLLESSAEVIPSPKITFNALFKVVSKEWQDDIAEMEKSSDHVEIQVTQEGVTVKALGDIVKAENNYQKGSDILLDIKAKEDTHAKFSLSYLARDFKFFEPKLCDVATIEMSTDMPIKATLHTKFGDLYHYLAPRIQDN